MQSGASDLPVVLAYHKVGSPELGGTWCTRSQFESHLEALSSAGWSACDPGEFARAAHGAPSGAAHLARSVLITFDDGYADFAANAWPAMQARHWRALLFVVSEFVGRRSIWALPLPGHRALHLDWPALRDLAAAGVAIGSHAATHRDLRRLGDAALAQELAGSRAALEDALGISVQSVAYPFGRADARVRAAARAAGFTLGFSMCPRAPSGDPLALPRSGVYIIDSPAAILDKVDRRRTMHSAQRLLGCAINAVAGIAAWHSARGG